MEGESVIFDCGNYLVIKCFAIISIDRLAFYLGNGHFFTGTANFETVLSLDVQLRVILFQLLEHLPRTFVIFAETYLHVLLPVVQAVISVTIKNLGVTRQPVIH